MLSSESDIESNIYESVESKIEKYRNLKNLLKYRNTVCVPPSS